MQESRGKGRPRNSFKVDARKVAMKLRWTESEIAEIKEGAKKAGESVSRFIRNAALSRARTLLIVLGMTAIIGASECRADDWTRTNSALQATYTALHVVDWIQSADIARRPVRVSTVYKDGMTTHPSALYVQENNSLLGRHPSERTVHIYFASTLIAHAAVSYLLPRGWREAWQAAGIGLEAWCVAGNFNAGITGGF